MKRPGPARGPDWKQFLGLAEQLLNQPNAAAQCQLIIETLQTRLNCTARIWLVSPHYPLPGEPDVPILPGSPAPELVLQVLDNGEVAAMTGADSTAKPTSPVKSPGVVAFPIASQGSLLAIGYVARDSGQPFHPTEWTFIEALAAHAAVAMQSARQLTLKNWRHEQLTLVRSVSAKIANVHDLDLLCQQVTQLIMQSFQFAHVSILTIEPGQEELFLRASVTQGHSSEEPVTYTVRPGQGMIGAAALSGKEQVSQDVTTHPHFRFLDELAGTRSEAALPLKIDLRVLGVLDLQSNRRGAFNEHDMLVLQALADAIALALEETRLYTEQKRRADQISAVFEITHALTSILDLDRLLEEVVQVIQKRFGYPYVHIFSVQTDRRKMFYLAGSGRLSQDLRLGDTAYDLDAAMGILSYAARSGKTYLSNDVSLDPIFLPAELPSADTRAELAIPLVFGEQVLGVLDLQSDRPGAFAAEDLSLLESLAASIAIAYHNATIYRSEQWRRQVGESFRDVASLLSTNVALDQLLDTILIQLERNLPCEAAAVWLVEESNQASESSGHKLRLAASWGVSSDALQKAYEESDQTRAWLETVLEQTEPGLRQPDERMGLLGTVLGFPKDYSSIAAPLRTGNRPLGLLTLAHHTANRYGSEALTIISTFASYAAVAIQNTRLLNEAQTQAWLATILLQVAEASQSVTSVDELLSAMVRLTRLLVGIKKCAMFLWDDTHEAFVLNAWYGFERRATRTIFREDEVPALAKLRANRTPVFIQDADAELNLPAASMPEDTGTLMLLPLQSRDALLGAFLIAHQSARTELGPHLDQRTLSILQGIAHQTAVALENLHLLEARQEEAYVTAVLLQVAQAVVSQNELSDILDTIVHLMPILVGIDASVVCLWDEQVESFRTAKIYAGNRQLESDLSECTYHGGEFKLVEQVRLNLSAFYCKLTPDIPAPSGWYELNPLPIDFIGADALLPGEDWLLAFPLSVKGELLGVLLAKETGASPASQQRRLEIITGIAQQAALAIQNERLKEEMVARERLEREVQVAREIQQAFLPNRLPRWQGWQIGARWQPARQVGGDFYDIFHLSRDRLGLAIADVADKGLAAALYMTVARTLIRAYAQSARSPSAVLERTNHPLVADAPHSMFVTAVFAMLWPETGQLVYANAGHNRPLLLRPAQGRIEVLPKGGMALGVLARIPLDDHTLSLEPGDTLLLYTDGVTESFSPQGEAFGEERLRITLQDCLGLNIEEMLAHLEARLVEFRAGAPVSDDLTLLAIQRKE